MRTATSVDYLTHKTDRIAVDTKLENSNRKSNPQSRYKMIFNLDEYEPMADKRVLMMPRNDTKSDNVLGPDDILPRSELVDSHLLHFLVSQNVKVCQQFDLPSAENYFCIASVPATISLCLCLCLCFNPQPLLLRTISLMPKLLGSMKLTDGNTCSTCLPLRYIVFIALILSLLGDNSICCLN